MEKILITGVAGFIGFHLAKLLLNQKFQVHGVDNLNDFYSVKLKRDRINILKENKNFKFIKLDISNQEEVKHALKDKNFKVVIHLAAQAGARLENSKYQSYFDSNIAGFFNLFLNIEKSKLEKFIFASSSSVYSNVDKIPFKEEFDIKTHKSFYGASKYSNEIFADTFSKDFRVKTIGLRFFTVYGPYGRPDMAYFDFTKKIFNEEPIKVFNDGQTFRDMTFIDDIVDGMGKAIEYDQKELFEIFNFGNSKVVNTLDMIIKIETALNKKAKILFEDSDREVTITQSNITKASRILNFHPQTDFDQGMEKFLNWYKKYHSIN
jgi:UDP-glucuronate 4-epimerase